jgi:uncharacterized membrane protein YoaK (UPF0700 family)
MFRHGKPRTFIHDLRLASMLSLAAGVVNIVGVLSVNTLTTNVTGHFAFFAEAFVNQNYSTAWIYILYVLSFLAGAVTSNFLIELMIRRNVSAPHAFPMILEIVLLGSAAAASINSSVSNYVIANILLFSMGLQNALVTKVSQATVRTTHLTGLFTDLGIEMSQLFFYRAEAQVRQLKQSIYLRLAIIGFFFAGGVVGGYTYEVIGVKALFLGAGWLLITLLYDNIRYRFVSVLKRIGK